ncbi:hypothetical protein DFH08DRAFT_997023 [Mycena albidolilacea]|uniref:Uncharacterized protein n=1 Tax=Mycena albidolilacea TaxID=1033008 RepID=A0AAD7A643_9AGAR|nr:hypothetical protein DFH08DRAFT_997023 [Mycena albidolilacea]
MAKSSAKYMLLPDADEGDALLKAPDTPGDDDDEANAEGEKAPQQGKNEGKAAATSPRRWTPLLSDRAHPRLAALHAAMLRAIVPEAIRNNAVRAARHLPQGLALGIHPLGVQITAASRLRLPSSIPDLRLREPQPSLFLSFAPSLTPSFFVRRPVLLPSSLSALVSFLPCNRLEPPDIDDNDGLWTYALVWLVLECVRTYAFAL